MAVSTTAERWLMRSKQCAQGEARVRLFCLPFAGGGASTYRTWPLAPELSDVEIVPVQLPGRENRLLEPPFTRADALVRALGQAVQPYLDRPFAIFGHSMGALLSFELARYLARRRLPMPERLFVSACRAPSRERPDEPIHALPDVAFIRALRRLQGTPERVLGDPELMQLVMPALRADFQLVETYRFTDDEPLDCPVSVFGGAHDTGVITTDLAGWADLTRGCFKLRVVPGNHFYLNEPAMRARVLRAIAHDLQHSGR